jgi:hypothetical protein
MNGSPSPEAIRECDSKASQLGLALQDLQAGLGAELEQLGIAAMAMAARAAGGRCSGSRPGCSGSRAGPSSLRPGSSCHRLSERDGSLFAATAALGAGLDRPPRYPRLHSGDHALAPAPPPSRAQDQRTARGALPARHRQPHALRPARRAQRVLAGPADEHRGLPGGNNHPCRTWGVRAARPQPLRRRAAQPL